MSYMRVNGINLYVEIEGDGEPLLLLHGLGGNTTQMHKDIEWLSQTFKTIAYDFRGHGRSDKAEGYTLDDHIGDALALLDKLGIEKARMIGVSGGSYIAQGVAASHPDRVDRLILVVAKAHGTKSSSQLFLESHADEMAGLSESENMRYIIDHAFAPGFMEKVGPETLQLLMRPEPVLSWVELEAANKAFEGFDFRPVLHQIKAPTLIINGKYDQLNPPSRGLEIASFIPDSTFVEMLHPGHAPSFEEPERFSELVMDFLNRQ